LYLEHRYRLPLLQFQLLRRAQLDSDYQHPPTFELTKTKTLLKVKKKIYLKRKRIVNIKGIHRERVSYEMLLKSGTDVSGRSSFVSIRCGDKWDLSRISLSEEAPNGYET
jgi:trehalose-6-phosphate synthase